MSTTVRIPGPLRRYTDNADKVQVDAGNLVDPALGDLVEG